MKTLHANVNSEFSIIYENALFLDPFVHRWIHRTVLSASLLPLAPFALLCGL